MNTVANQSQPKKAVPLIYRLQRMFLAACVVLGILTALVLVVTSPQYYGLKSGAAVVLAAFASANPVLMQVHIIVGVFIVYLLPVSFLTMAWLPMRRAPWFASIVILIVFIGVLPIASFSAQDALTYDLAHMGSNPLFLTIMEQFNDDRVMSYYNVLFVIGTVLAPMLIGIALWRTRVVPVWAAVLITFSRFLVLLYIFVPSLPAVYSQTLSWVPLFIGSIAVALAIVKLPYNER